MCNLTRRKSCYQHNRVADDKFLPCPKSDKFLPLEEISAWQWFNFADGNEIQTAQMSLLSFFVSSINALIANVICELTCRGCVDDVDA